MTDFCVSNCWLLVLILHRVSFSIFTPIQQPLKRLFKILGYGFLVLLVLLLAAYLLVQTTPVQNWLVDKVASTISKDLGTPVTIKKVNFSLFNKMNLEGAYVEDRNKDTLLYAGKINVLITDWFFTKEQIVLENIELEDASIYLHRKDSIWNYQYLLDYFASPKSGKKKKNIELGLKKIRLTHINLLNKDEWRGEDLALHLRSLLMEANDINFAKKLADIKALSIEEPIFSVYNYPGLRGKRLRKADTVTTYNTLRWNPDDWKLMAETVSIKNGAFKNEVKMDRPVHYYFDGQHILFSSINSEFKNVRLIKDTLKGSMALTAKERSGLDINRFTADVVMQPEAMEFSRLDIRTPRSRLKNYFAMRYDSFDDMSDFIEKVRMQGVFKEAILHSDDIAYFAPELESWKRNIQLTGTIKGTVDNLTGKGVQIEAGKNSFLNGDITIKGLPDIDKTFIDFHSNDFRVTYADATAMVPLLKNIREPRLDRLQYLRFKGNYTGFIKNFVALGSVETALGNVAIDINMQFPDNQPTSYIGKLTTGNFKLGQFLDQKLLGDISFNGTLKGRGISLKNLNAQLDGHIDNLEYNNYIYRNINAKGTLSERLFNGNLIANDPNLGIQLDGLVDFSKREPRFNFLAKVDRVNLKRLNLYREDIDIAGYFRFNFTGSTIDNFLGTAKIYDASVFKNGRRISFDSLSIESKQMGKDKSIVAVSNEFDAAIAGEFSIRELPAAFQTFLNRYYPSYINPSKKKLTSENFSFVITTKKVDDYLDIFDKNLNGFNYTSLSGRINTKENLFDLDAEVPLFGYKNMVFHSVNLKGRGNLDSLSLLGNVGEIFVNDSLNFPGTQINIQSANDVSKVQITTSANQTLNSANISGKLTTMQNGFNLVFDPSNFEINGKTWTIEKDGELTLSKSLVTTEGLRIYSGNQEVLINSGPSTDGYSNDLTIDFKKINIGDFAPFFVKSNRLEGLLSGQVDVMDPFGKMSVDVKAEAEQFRLDDDSIGKLQLTSNYTKASGKVNVSALSENEEYNFDLNGFVNLADSTGTGVDITAYPKKLNINFLEKYLSGIFSKVQGYAAGDFRIVGKGNNLKYLGNLTLTEGALMVDYTKCLYRIPKAVIKMDEDGIDFGNFTLKDELNNTGELLYGKLYHNNFKDMAFDFRLKTNQLLLLNTKQTDNKQFYGRAIGRANFSFSGPQEAMEMEIEAEPTDSSEISLPVGASSQSKGEPGYLGWKVYGTEMQQGKSGKAESNLNVIVDITANNLAKINVVLDEVAGDKISAIGHGKLRLTSANDDLQLNGRFDVDKGYYTFTFQSFLRVFELQNDVTNYISWNKDPYNADINISALYKVPRASFSNLAIPNAVVDDPQVRNFQGQMDVIAHLTEKLRNPKIKFDIKIPANSYIANNQDATRVMDLIKRDENELNKQVSLLVVFNNFGPLSTTGSNPTFNVGRSALEGIVVNSISGIISGELTKQFSNFFQNVLKDPTIQVNVNASVYSSSNLDALGASSTTSQQFLNRSAVNLSFSKNYFNERLTFIVGSALDFGISGSGSNTTTKNFQFLPDVTAQWKLTPDGKFLMNFFYRENASYLGTSIGKQSRSGASISYRKEFENLKDLFKKKPKKPYVPPPSVTINK